MTVPSDSSANRVLIFAPSFLPGFKAGGPIRSVAWTLDTLTSRRALLITADRDLGDEAPYAGLSGTIQDYGHHQVFYVNIHSIKHLLRLCRVVAQERWSILYLNSYWSPEFTALPQLLRIVGIIRAPQVLIAPRGELAQSALGIKARKKLLLRPAYRLISGFNHAAFHATAAHEKEAVLRWYPRSLVISAPAGQTQAGPHAEQHNPIPRVVYISRVAPIKNTHLLTAALSRLQFPVRVELYGPIEDYSYWEQCEADISNAPAHVDVEYLGPLPSHAVREVLSSADIFVLPTQGENHGHAIAEALAVGCAAVIPDTTPWTKVIEAGGGEIIEPLTAEGVEHALERIVTRWQGDQHRLSNEVSQAYLSWLEKQDSTNAVEMLLAQGEQHTQHTGRILWIQNHPTPQTAEPLNNIAKVFPDLRVIYRDMTSKGRGWGNLPLSHFNQQAPQHGVLLQLIAGIQAARAADSLVTFGYASAYQIAAILTARMRRIPIFIRSDSSATAENAKPRWLKSAKRLLLPAILGTKMRAWATGKDNADYWKLYGIGSQILIPFESPVPPPKEPTKPLPHRLLYVGRLSPEKGIEDLLKAGEILAQSDHDFRLIVAGDGPLADSLPRPPWVDYLGAVHHDELGSLYTSACALVVPSRREAYGLIVKEALQFGLPVVATEIVPTAKELCDHGWNITKAGDIAALARAMGTALSSDRWIPREPVDATAVMIEELRYASTHGKRAVDL